MEKKYDPNQLLLSVAICFESEGKTLFEVPNEEIAKYKIEIEIKDSAKKYTIAMDKKGEVLLLEGVDLSGWIKKHEVLEQNKDNLTAVKIFKQNLEIVKFDTFDDFLKIIEV